VKILVTGGSGFVGSHILNKLLKSDKDYQVLSFVREVKDSLKKHEDLTWAKADLNDTSSFVSKIEDFKPEVVIHSAWEGIPDFDAPNCLKNLNQSINFINTILKVQTCKKLLIPGSCFEYQRKKGICKESETLEGKDFFSWAKLSLLNYLLLQTKKNEISLGWFRLFYAYGPGQREGSLIPSIINSIQLNKLPNLSTPQNANDFIFIEDVAELFEMAIYKDFSSGIYNLGTGETSKVLEICRIIEKKILGGFDLTSRLEEETKNSKKEVDFFASTNKTFKTFNWKPNTNLEEGISSILT